MKYIQPLKKRKKVNLSPLKPNVLVRRHRGNLFLVFKLLLVLILMCGICYVVFFSDILRISTVKVSSNLEFISGLDLDTVAKAGSVNKNILLFNTGNLEKNLENTFLAAKSISVKKEFPGSLVIYVVERKPLALILKNGELFMIDEEGFVLGLVEEKFSELPKIDYTGEVSVGHFIDKNTVPLYLELVTNLNDEKLKASSISISEKYATLYLENGTKVLIGNKKDKAMALKTVASLLSKLSDGVKKVAKIDLRYDKVIVSYD